jgi:Holliday junction resolvase
MDKENIDKPPKNKTERLLWHKLKRKGWDITKRGWPDFICFKDDKIVVIEVKRKKGYKLKKRQYQALKALSNAGIKSYK